MIIIIIIIDIIIIIIIDIIVIIIIDIIDIIVNCISYKNYFNIYKQFS